MENLFMLVLFAELFMSCIKNEMLKYNTARTDNIEEYLKTHKYVKLSENLNKQTEEEKLDYSESYKLI